eukprot:2319378-Prymnesium_polylepis.1
MSVDICAGDSTPRSTHAQVCQIVADADCIRCQPVFITGLVVNGDTFHKVLASELVGECVHSIHVCSVAEIGGVGATGVGGDCAGIAIMALGGSAVSEPCVSFKMVRIC